MGPANDVIESLVAQHEFFAGVERLEPLAAVLPLLASRLEQVSIVGVHSDPDRERELRVSIVVNADALVARSIPEKPGAAEMEGSSRHEFLFIGGKVWVGKVDREERVILLHGGTEEKGPVCSERELKLGKKTGALMIEALRARNDLVDVTVAIEDGERLSVFQHFHAVLGQRGRREDVELIVPADDLAHQRVSLKTSALVRLILRATSAVANITIPIPNRPGPGP
jgi:hypothetical protein